jgi:Ser-tRNA(Ala) deacylase AlaX
MKNLVLLAALAFAGSAFAQETKAPAKPAHPAHATKAAAVKTHEVEAEIVSVDATAKTVTIKADPENKTVPVQGKALAHLASHKAGDKVTLVCLDNDKGEHQAVVDFKAAKPAAPAKPAAN